MNGAIPILDPRKDAQLQTQNELIARMQSLMVNYIELKGLTNLEAIAALDCVKLSLMMQTIEVKKVGKV